MKTICYMLQKRRLSLLKENADDDLDVPNITYTTIFLYNTITIVHFLLLQSSRVTMVIITTLPHVTMVTTLFQNIFVLISHGKTYILNYYTLKLFFLLTYDFPT